MKFLIAGAGLGGLTAAWRLHQAGHEVHVYEARDRVGGRTYSVRLRNGVVVEQGAISIRAEEHAIRALCAELELELIGVGFPVGRWEAGLDETRTIDEVEWIYEALGARAQERHDIGAGDESMADAFRAVLGADYSAHSMYRNLETALSAPLETLSAQGFASLYLGAVWGAGGTDGAVDTVEDSTGYVEHQVRVLGGNQRITREIARRLGDAVHLSSPVTRVDQDAAGVRFRLDDGSVVEGGAAVVALPLPLLRELPLGFEIPALMRRAMDTLVMGSSAMVNVELAEGSAPSCAADPVDWWTSANFASGPNELLSDRALTSFLGTDRIIDNVLAQGAASALSHIRTLRSDLPIAEDPQVVVTDWRAEEWSGGSYPNWGVGWDPSMNEAFADRTVGRVAFAGADTAGALMGGMDGAVRTGFLAQEQLLAKLR